MACAHFLSMAAISDLPWNSIIRLAQIVEAQAWASFQPSAWQHTSTYCSTWVIVHGCFHLPSEWNTRVSARQLQWMKSIGCKCSNLSRHGPRRRIKLTVRVPRQNRPWQRLLQVLLATSLTRAAAKAAEAPSQSMIGTDHCVLYAFQNPKMSYSCLASTADGDKTAQES